MNCISSFFLYKKITEHRKETNMFTISEICLNKHRFKTNSFFSKKGRNIDRLNIKKMLKMHGMSDKEINVQMNLQKFFNIIKAEYNKGE